MDTSSISLINSTRSAYEGDMYLDTVAKKYRIGLTHGRMGAITDNQRIDSVFIQNDSLKVLIEDGADIVVDKAEYINRVGIINHSFKTADHGGCYLLNGRAHLYP